MGHDFVGGVALFQEFWPAWQKEADWHARFRLVGVPLSELEVAHGPASAGKAPCWLGEGERERFVGLTSAKRRQEWLGGRLAAKMAAAGLRGEAAAWRSIEIRVGAGGRPMVDGGPHLSISHSGPLAVALAAEKPCGLDVQQLTSGLLRVRSRYAAPEEEALLAGALPVHPLLSRLALLWAAKEAVRKLGLVRPLTSLLATRMVAARGSATPEAPLRLILLGPSGGDAAGIELTVLALLSQGMAWAVCLAPQPVTE